MKIKEARFSRLKNPTRSQHKWSLRKGGMKTNRWVGYLSPVDTKGIMKRIPVTRLKPQTISHTDTPIKHNWI